MHMKQQLFASAFAALAAILPAGTAGAEITLGNGDAVSLATILASEDRKVRIDDKIFTFESYASCAMVQR